MDDTIFLTTVLRIVEDFNCHIDDFDLKNRTINISGSEDDQRKCAIKLEEILGDYID